MKKMIAGAILGILVCGGIVSANGLSVKSLNFLAPVVSDKGTVILPKEGEIVYERTTSEAGFWGHTNSQWIPLGGSNSVVPTGTVLPFLGSVAPPGYRIADGSAISTGGANAALYALIGGTYGENTALGTFNLPDLRGRFVRGLDSTGTVDPGPRVNPSTGTAYSGVGSIQEDAFKSHNHLNGFGTNQNLNQFGTTSFGTMSTADVGIRTNYYLPYTSTEGGGSETRPKNMAMNYIIKL